MKETILALWDDLTFLETGEKITADETVTISLDGRYAEVDLTKRHADGLRAYLEVYFKAGQSPSDPAGEPAAGETSHTKHSRAYNTAMRAYAEANGIDYLTKSSGSYYYSIELRRRFAAHLAATGEVIE